MKQERWRRIKGFSGYSISSHGRIRNDRRDIILKLSISDVRGNKRYTCLLHIGKGKQKRVLVHRLVAIVFVPNPHNKPEVNHDDLNPLNNYYENLKWATRSENMLHYFEKCGRATGKVRKIVSISRIRELADKYPKLCKPEFIALLLE